MASATLKLLMDLEDNVSGQMAKIKTNLDNFSGKVESLEPTFKKMATVGTAGFAAIAGVVGVAVANFGEAERAQRQLEHAVLDVSKGTREQVEAISDLSDALQKKAGIDGDALKMGTAQLSTFGLQSTSVVALTKSLADLTVNQNGVNASADQYVQSANVIAKALQGQFGVLEKSGIRFTEHQKSIIENGKESEKVAAIIEGLNQNLRETTDTLGGVDVASAKMSRSFGEIMESVGKSFAPLLEQISATITPFLAKMQEWIEANPTLARNIIVATAAIFGLLAVVGTIGLVIPSIIAGFGALATAASAVGVAITFMMGPIGLVILAIGALIAAGVLLYQHWDQVKGFAESIWNSITQTISNAMSTAASIMSSIWEGIKTVFQTAVFFIVGLWAMLLDALFPGWQAALQNIYNTLVAVWSSIAGFIKVGWADLSKSWSENLTAISKVWNDAWTGVKEVFSAIWETIKSVAQAAFDWIKQGIDALLAPLQNLIDLAQRAFNAAKSALGSVGSSISSGIQSVIDRGASLLGRATGGPVLAGSSYLVGEHGPEIFTPGYSGRIGGLQMAGGGAIFNITITGNTLLDRDATRKIGGELVKYLKDNMRL